MAIAITGRFFDGKNSKPCCVDIRVTGEGLVLRSPDTGLDVTWQMLDIRVLEEPVPPQSIRLGTVSDPDARLIVEYGDGWKALSLLLPCSARPGVRISGSWRSLAGYGVLAGVVVFLIMQGLPRVLEKTATWIPHSWLNSLGQYAIEGNFSAPVCAEGAGLNALRKLTLPLVSKGDAGRVYKIAVIKGKEANAVTMPGDYIVILEGLLQRAKTAEEVAGVIAHEMGHVHLQHPARGAVRNAGISLLLYAMMGNSKAVSVAGYINDTRFSREDELAADKYAVELMNSIGMDGRSLADFLKRPENDGQDKKNIKQKTAVSEASALDYLSTHPATVERARVIEALSIVKRGERKPMEAGEWGALKGICKRTMSLKVWLDALSP